MKNKWHFWFLLSGGSFLMSFVVLTSFLLLNRLCFEEYGILYHDKPMSPIAEFVLRYSCFYSCSLLIQPSYATIVILKRWPLSADQHQHLIAIFCANAMLAVVLVTVQIVAICLSLLEHVVGMITA